MQLEAVKMGYPVMNVEMNYRLGGEFAMSSVFSI
jgi:ribosomal protein L2